MQGSPLAIWATPKARLPLSICPALNISWNDLRLHCFDRQRSTLLYRDEKRSFHDMLRATPNARLLLAICPALNISWNDLRLPCLDRQRSTLLYRDEKRSFHDMLRATPRMQGPPLQFVPPLTSHGMVCDYIVWIDRDLHSYIEMKRDHFMTC